MAAFSSPNRAHSLGRWGEHRAARFLEGREVDLVVRRDDVLAFVEVKTRAGEGFGGAMEAITWRKRREIEAVAAHFLATRGMAGVAIRFDAVAVTLLPGSHVVRVEHVPDAWRPGWP